MGLIGKLLVGLFGGNRNVVTEVAGAFIENAEAKGQRQAAYGQAALSQFAAEFQIERRGWFDRFMDGLNRLPRPLMVLAVFSLFGSAMFDPIWFAARMEGLKLVPEPLWWIAGVIVGFYFGGRFQAKAQEFRRSVAQTSSLVPGVVETVQELEKLRADSVGAADTGSDAELELSATDAPPDNPAIQAWLEEKEQ